MSGAGGVTGQERERESAGVYRSGVGDGTTPQQVRRELITAENRRTAQTFRLIIVIGSEVLKVVGNLQYFVKPLRSM